MSDPALNLPVKSTFDPSGTDAALAALRKLQQEQTKAAPKAGGGGDPFRGVSQSAQMAERDTLRYATAMASAQRATGDTAGAVETMRGAMAQMTPNTIEAHQATTRLAQAQTALQKELKGGASYAQQFGAAMQSSLMGLVGPAAAAGAAIAAVSQTGELIKLGAQAEQARGAFDRLAATAGTTGESLVQALRAASGGTINDLNLQLAANRAQLLGVADSAGEFSTLMAIARDRAQQMGISTQFAFDSLVTGLGRGSALILDNLGITLSVAEANEAYAASIGKTVSQLSEAEKKTALINAVLAQGKASLEATGGAAETTAVKLERATAAIDNAKSSLGQFLALRAGPFADDITKIADALSGVGSALEGFKGGLDVSTRIGPLATINGLLDSIIDQVNELAGTNMPDLATPFKASASATGEFFSSLAAGEGLFKALADAGNTTTSAMQGEAAAATQSAQAAADSAAVHAHLASEHANNAVAADADAVATAHLRDEHLAGGEAADNAARMTAQSAINSQIDAAAKEEQAAKTELARLKADEAAVAFMALYPNIDASGVASLVAAGKIDPLLAQLILARIRADEARNALMLFNMQAGIKAAGPGFGTRSDADELKQDQLAARSTANRAAATKRYNDQLAAQRDRIAAVGTADQKVTLAEQDLAAARARYGQNSAEAYRAETALIQARDRATKAAGGGGGGGGGGARASAAEQTGSRLQDIERSSGNKLAEINEQTQQKLAAIEQKYAEKRAQAARDLADDIARANAATKFDQELNDFDKFQKNLSDEQKAALADREKAEAEYNSKVAAAQEEARQMAASGDAEEAEAVLKARTDQAEREREIAERAAEAKRDAGKGQAAAVDAEAQQAVEASRQQAETEIAIAHAKAQEKAQAQQAEKDAVVAQAEEQKNKVVSAAEEAASKVKGASDSQKATVIGNLKAQADAVNAWADRVESAAGRAQRAMGGVSGPPSGGDGGDGGGGDTGGAASAQGGASFRGGGGRAASGGGGGTVEAAIQTLNDAAEIIKVIKPFVAANKGAVKLLNEYSLTVKSAVGSLLAIQDLRARLVAPQPVLDIKQVEQLKSDVERVLNLMMSIDASATTKVRVFAKYLETEKGAVDILNTIADLRKDLSTPTPPIDANYVLELIATSNIVIGLIFSQLIPLKQREVDGIKNYADAAAQAIGVLRNVADLRKDLAEQKNIAPFDMVLIADLVRKAADITRLVQSQLVPLTDKQAAGIDTYATGVAASVGLLKDVADLRKDLADQKTIAPIDVVLVQTLAAQAKRITQLVLSQLIPLTEAQADGFVRYADTAGAAVRILKDVADLRKELSGGQLGALDVRLIDQLAENTRRIAQAVLSRMLPASEETSEAARRYADTAGAAVSAIKDTLGLTSNLFADYKSPSNAQINTIANDSKRLVRAMMAAAATMDKDGIDAAKGFAEALGASFGALSDGLEFMDRLRFTELRIDPGRLAQFQRSTLQTLNTLSVLSARAAQIPSGNLAALQAANAAIASTADAAIKLAAVPMNIPQLPNMFGGGGGGGGQNIVVNINNPPANMDVPRTHKQIMDGIRRDVQFRGK